MAEQGFCKAQVVGSTPTLGSTDFTHEGGDGRERLAASAAAHEVPMARRAAQESACLHGANRP